MENYNRSINYIWCSIILSTLIMLGCTDTPKPPDADTVAVYNGGKINREDFQVAVDTLYQSIGENGDTIRHLRNKTVYRRFVEDLVVDRLIKQKIVEMKLENRESIKHVMKHVSEELNISELHTQAHDRGIKVTDQEIKERYEKDRTLFAQATLVQATEEIRVQIQIEKEKNYFESYLDKLRENAVITRYDELLIVPKPNEAELRMYYEQNRSSYSAETFEEAREAIEKEAKIRRTEKWFNENAYRTLLTIHGKRITLGEFYQELLELQESERRRFNTNNGRSELLDKMIDRLLVIEDTYDQMLDTETKNKRGHIREDVLRQVFHQEQVDDQINIPEEEIRAFFDENTDQFKIPARIQINYLRIGAGQTEIEKKQAEEKVREAYKKLKPGMLKLNKGLPFNEVAMEYSEDKETAKKGGSLEGWITESKGLIEEIAIHGFHENVLGLGEKDISRPFLFHGSYYIVQVRERQEPIPMAYADARDAIEQELKARKHDELTTKIEETMIDGAKLVIFDEVIETILKEQNKEEEGAPE